MSSEIRRFGPATRTMKELVKVRGEDRGEVGALEQGACLRSPHIRAPLVELEPAELAVEETVLGQRCLAFLIDAAVVVVVFGNMLLRFGCAELRFEGASNICAIAYIVSFGVAGKRLNAPEFNGCSC